LRGPYFPTAGAPAGAAPSGGGGGKRMTVAEKKEQERREEGERETDRILQEACDQDMKALEESVRISLGLDPVQPARTHKPTSTVTGDRKPTAATTSAGTVTARTAASALAATTSTRKPLVSSTKQAAVKPASAGRLSTKPAAAVTGRKPLSSKTNVSAFKPTDAESRHKTAAAASKTTLGYAKGRDVSKTARSGLGGVFAAPKPTAAGKENRMAEVRRKAIKAAEEEERCLQEIRNRSLLGDGGEELDDMGFGGRGASGWMEFDAGEEEDFQLQLPDGI